MSSAEIERVLNAMPGVVETAAIAVPPLGGGPSLLVIFAVLEEGGDHLQACPERSRRDAMQQTIRRGAQSALQNSRSGSSGIAAAHRVEQGDGGGFAGAIWKKIVRNRDKEHPMRHGLSVRFAAASSDLSG